MTGTEAVADALPPGPVAISSNVAPAGPQTVVLPLGGTSVVGPPATEMVADVALVVDQVAVWRMPPLHCLSRPVTRKPPMTGGSAAGGSVVVPPSGSSGDRKSTRLNSSHSQISYAVFCLK